MDAGRKLGQYVSGKRRYEEREVRKKTLAIYAPIVAESLAHILEKDKAKVLKKLKEIIEKKYMEIEAEAAEEEAEENGEGVFKEDSE